MAQAASPRLKVVVVQFGARRNYELARMLEERGALVALHTDAAWPKGAPSLVQRLIGRLSPHAKRAIARRTVEGIPAGRLRGSLLPTIAGAACGAVGIDWERRDIVQNRVLGRLARRWGFADANVLLTPDGNGGGPLLAHARAAGLKVATDIIITPLATEILAEEHRRWPHWEGGRDLARAVAIERRRIEEVVALSDLLLCPSRTVLEGLGAVRGFDPARAVLVPYGASYVAAPRSALRPEPGRVLFAGNAPLRKGLPYLAAAATILKRRDAAVRVVVAGAVAATIKADALCGDLEFLGPLGGAAMADEFARADVFCLPSLAEGSASVVLEAMTCGIPCVVTAAAGSPVDDGIEGRVVAPRDPESLADAILAIVRDRDRRAAMSEAARAAAGRHSPEAVGRRLNDALSVLVTGKAA